MALVLKLGDELRLRISTTGKASAELLRLRITSARTGYELALLSAVPGISSRVVGTHATESELWAGLASLAATWPTATPLPTAGQYELAMLLVVIGTAGKVLDSHRYPTEAELWAGLADHAAGRQADIALAMLGEESRDRAGRGWR